MNKQSLPVIISPYLKRLIEQTGGESGPIGRQFLPTPQEHTLLTEIDPQEEYAYEVAPGLLYKYTGQIDKQHTIAYPGRVLWTISRYCGAYCRFCFRGRFVGTPSDKNGLSKDLLSSKPYLSEKDIAEVIHFITQHQEINEVILSGGDPFITPQTYLESIIRQLISLQQSKQIPFIRIHTRAPITQPSIVTDQLIQLLSGISLPHIVLHINHPKEITPEVLSAVEKLRSIGALLFAQSVLLKGVNDSVDTLQELFISCAQTGIRPYYLHYNDPVSWAEHFTVPFDKAVSLWQSLRPRLSGICATAKFVIDTPHGKGKITVPDSVWITKNTYTDFEGKQHTMPSFPS